jgi:hypothetical protein
MLDNDKDKYDELENLPEAGGELEEVPAEALEEPYGQRTEAMDDIVAQAQPQQVESPPAQAQEGGTDLAKKIEEAAKVRDASEYLRGQKQVKVIKKSAIKGIVDEIIKTYGGIEHKDLLSKIAEYELNISNLRQDLERYKEERQSLQDDIALKYLKEIEELKMRLATAEEMLSQDTSKEKMRKLEEEVLYLRQRVEELEKGLEFVATIEEFDYGMAMEAATEQREKAVMLAETAARALEAQPENEKLGALNQTLAALGKRYEFMTDLFKKCSRSYSDKLKQVDQKEGSIEVVAELIRLNARNRGWNKELEIWNSFLERAEQSVRGN